MIGISGHETMSLPQAEASGQEIVAKTEDAVDQSHSYC